MPRQINSTGNISVQLTATLIITSNTPRAGVLISNLDATASVYIGNADVTVANGYTLKAGHSITVPVQNAIYGIASGAPVAITFMEVQ